MKDMITVQAKLDSNADARLQRDVKAAFKALTEALASTGMHYEEIHLELWNSEKGERVTGRTTPDSLFNDLTKLFIEGGKNAYRTVESQQFMDRVEELQDQINGIQNQ